MLLCSPHRTATPSTQGESDNPASERQPVTHVAETDQTRYKVVTTALLVPYSRITLLSGIKIMHYLLAHCVVMLPP